MFNFDADKINIINRDEEDTQTLTTDAEKQVGDGEATTDQPEGTSKEDDKPDGTESQANDPDVSTSDNQDSEDKPEEEAGESTPEPDQEPEPEQKPTEPDYDKLISEKTNGRVDSFASLSERLDRLSQLEEESKKTPEIEFPSEQHRKAYEFLTSNEGDFSTLKRQYHQILSYDVENLDDKSAQREAFVLKRTDLSPAKARETFDARFDHLYGDLDELEGRDRIVREDEIAEKTAEARQFLKQRQESIYSEMKEQKQTQETAKAPEVDAEQQAKEAEEQKMKFRSDIDNKLNGFNKVEFTLGDDKDIPKESVALPLNEAQLNQLKEDMASPDQFFTKQISNMQDANGQVDMKQYAEFMYWMSHKDEIKSRLHSQGFASGQLKKLQEAKNLDTQKQSVPDGGQPKKGFWDVAAEAINKNR